MPRLGRERPDSRKLRWRCEMPEESAKSSWLDPRAWRHSLSRRPKGGALAGASEVAVRMPPLSLPRDATGNYLSIQLSNAPDNALLTTELANGYWYYDYYYYSYDYGYYDYGYYWY